MHRFPSVIVECHNFLSFSFSFIILIPLPPLRFNKTGATIPYPSVIASRLRRGNPEFIIIKKSIIIAKHNFSFRHLESYSVIAKKEITKHYTIGIQNACIASPPSLRAACGEVIQKIN
jgi:hypothetical protein